MEDEITRLMLGLYDKIVTDSNTVLIEHFQLENQFAAPLIANKSGKIPHQGQIAYRGTYIEFRFHGTGCEYKVDGIIADFDYNLDSSNLRIIFGPYEFSKFVQTLVHKSLSLIKSDKDVIKSLSNITKNKGIIFNL